jgi:hypothetical protein
MTVPSNILQQVQTYQDSSLAYFENLCCLANIANSKFKDFQNKTANLGDTINFDIPPRSVAGNGLVASFQASQQLLQPLVCDQAANASRAFTAQQFIFNVEDYMDKFGKADIAELGTRVELNLGKNIISSVPVMTVNSQGQSVPTGALHTESGPFRFFGDGTTAISSYQQLAQMLVNFKNFGSVRQGIKVVLPDTVIPAIIGTGLNQFAPERNNKDAMSWEIGAFGTPPVEYYQSNLLPTHIAGTLGNDGTPLTVVSTNDPTGANITQITFSGAGTDSEAIKSGDLLEFGDNVSGFDNMRFMLYVGHEPSQQPVQFRATADAASSGGNVTVTFTPPLVSVVNSNQNLNQPIQAGMQVNVLPSHKAGLVIGGDAFFLAMPQLPEEVPYPTASKSDPDTGLSLRMYYGSLFGQNQRGLINDTIWGATIVPVYSMRIAFPL